MAKFCTNCGKELDENAAICLNCGVLTGNNNQNNASNNTKNQKKKWLPTWAIILIVVGCVILLPLIFITIIAVTAYKIVSDTNFNEIIEETVVQRGTIGDALRTDDFEIILTDALIYSSIGIDENKLDIPSEGKEYLVFFFDVKNISDDNEYISDYDFTGYVDGYKLASLAYLYNDIDGINELDANLPPNKKTKGYVAFEVDTSWQEFELHYEGWFDEEGLVFSVVNEENSNITGA